MGFRVWVWGLGFVFAFSVVAWAVTDAPRIEFPGDYLGIWEPAFQGGYTAPGLKQLGFRV